jgi:uncharacterized linocin/CFP29 family protein
MDHLLREIAPISDGAWKDLDDEARQRSAIGLAARKVVDFSGPYGWEHSATNLGGSEQVASRLAEGVSAQRRTSAALVELRADFVVAMSELANMERGAKDPDLGDLDRAARQMAFAENVAVFYGLEGVFRGMSQRSPYDPDQLGSTAAAYPSRVATAVGRLLDAGISGPYALVLGPEQHTLVSGEAQQGAYLLLEHLAKIVGGPVLRAPGVDGALVVSLRGGDFLFEAGQDLSVGYNSHDGEVVRLYLQESFSFLVATPEAAVAMIP